MSTLTFLSTDRRYGLILEGRHLRAMARHWRSHAPSETGGTFAGRYTEDLRYAVVHKVLLVPGEEGAGSLRAFVRDGLWLTGILLQIWRRSQGTEYYLGEWHSHPGQPPTPSMADKHEMSSIASDPREECAVPVLVIIGNDLSEPRKDVRAFVFPRDKRPVEMKLAES